MLLVSIEIPCHPVPFLANRMRDRIYIENRARHNGLLTKSEDGRVSAPPYLFILFGFIIALQMDGEELSQVEDGGEQLQQQ